MVVAVVLAPALEVDSKLCVSRWHVDTPRPSVNTPTRVGTWRGLDRPTDCELSIMQYTTTTTTQRWCSGCRSEARVARWLQTSCIRYRGPKGGTSATNTASGVFDSWSAFACDTDYRYPQEASCRQNSVLLSKSSQASRALLRRFPLLTLSQHLNPLEHAQRTSCGNVTRASSEVCAVGWRRRHGCLSVLP